ncbi:hypothetical protein WJX79_006001 [Trebouxia sp. C0005]
MAAQGPATPSALYKMISIPEAQEIVLSETQPLPSVSVGFVDAVGSVLAENVQAPENVPPFPASIKDGYAVVTADGPGEYIVAFAAHAGRQQPRLQSGSVAYITTGAPVPEGADAVVQIENTEQLSERQDGEKRVRIVKAASQAGEDIRAVGSDIKVGQTVLQAGDMLGPAEIGILATVGAATLKVHRTPVVAVLSTGDEVVEPTTQHLHPGQIRDANRAMLVAACKVAGAQVVDLGIARDTEGHVEACLEKAINQQVDVLVTTGGVSMGERDFIKPLLERHGKVHFGKVKMKPGKPLTFATIELDSSSKRRMLVFGLPGNPVSSIVTFNLVVVPALHKMAGWQHPMPRRVHVRTSQDLKLDPERPEYHRATVHWRRPPKVSDSHIGGEFAAESTGGQISSRLLSMRSANTLLEFPAAKGTIPKGSMVSALLIQDLAGMPISEHLTPTASPAHYEFERKFEGFSQD